MKRMTTAALVCGVVLAASVGSEAEEAPGVAGVDVIVKQVAGKRDVTNPWGIFALDALPAGSYTLSFKARPANKSRGITRDKVIVATLYSIKIDGIKRPVKRTGLTSDKLVAGIDIPVEVGPGARIRGEVRPEANKKMVWVPAVPGSNLPGHWVEEGSKEAPRFHTETYNSRDWQSANR